MSNMKALLVPFAEESQLYKDPTTSKPSLPPNVPGHPRVPLHNVAELREFLCRELCASDLERMASRLWIMSTQSSSNISPLHQQKVKGRNIIVTEDPRLHLVWIYDRVFIKPLPKYLMSFSFWSEYINNRNSVLLGNTQAEQESYSMIRMSALGFLRTYYYLIQHESDLNIAVNESRLLPSGITWTEYCAFSQNLAAIGDGVVSKRYHYGELRLTRLNLWAKLLIGKFHYERVHGQYGAFFAQFYGPLLFIFGVLSIILSAMQVELGAESLLATHQWESVWFVCRWFAVIVLMCIFLLTIILVMLLVGMIVDECAFALKARYKRRKLKRLQFQGA